MRLSTALQQKKILVADGAWGTQLSLRGLKTGECPDDWCRSHYEQVRAVAESYIAAGADLVESNSFGASRIKLAGFGLENEDKEINRLAARATKEAAERLGKDIVVLGSMGPCGKLLLLGDVEEDELYDAFARQAEGLQLGGADAACIETMSDLEEAQIAMRAVKENTDMEIIALFTFARTKMGTYRTMMGLSPEDAAQGAAESGATVVGSNCGYGMAHMGEILEAMKEGAPTLPRMVNANAGLPQQTANGIVYPETPEQTATFVPALLAAGTRIIGGCCGTTPAHIAAVRDAVEKWLK